MNDHNVTYKISYVILGGSHTGAIVNTPSKPEIGDIVELGNIKFMIVEIVDLLPSRSNYHYLHVTCKPILETE